MAKSLATYWNPLAPENAGRWAPIRGLEGMAEELTLSIDPNTGEYTRLTRFRPGADTTPFGGKSHTYPEEVFVVSGRLFDEAFGLWLETGQPSAGGGAWVIPDGCRLRCAGTVLPQSRRGWCRRRTRRCRRPRRQ
jgi:hypothetical protein